MPTNQVDAMRTSNRKYTRYRQHDLVVVSEDMGNPESHDEQTANPDD